MSGCLKQSTDDISKTVATAETPEQLYNLYNSPSPLKFLQDIKASENSPGKDWYKIKEVDGSGDDLNKGFGGSYMYLWACTTSCSTDAVTGMVVFQSNTGNGQLGQDIAKEAGGDYRYIITKKETGEQKVDVTSLKLWRTGSSDSKPSKYGYTDWTTDINNGRGGDYLYVCWKKM